MAPKKIKMNLQYKFTKEELLDLGRTLGESQLALRQLDDDRKMVVDEWKAKISSQEAAINDLSNKTSSGYEYRSIECSVTYDVPIKGQKTIMRLDSGAVVKIMEMDDADKQDQLPL